MTFADISQNVLGPLPIHYIVIQYPQQMVPVSFCDLSHTFHKQVANVSKHVFVILLWGNLTSPLISLPRPMEKPLKSRWWAVYGLELNEQNPAWPPPLSLMPGKSVVAECLYNAKSLCHPPQGGFHIAIAISIGIVNMLWQCVVTKSLYKVILVDHLEPSIILV